MPRTAQNFCTLLTMLRIICIYPTWIVTKPGGLTVTESLACRLPLAIYNAFPGQERDNAEFLVKTGAAIMLDKLNGAEQVCTLLGNPDKLAEMKRFCGNLAQENSAEKIYDLAKKLVNED